MRIPPVLNLNCLSKLSKAVVYPKPFLLFFFLLSGSIFLKAEGSKDFMNYAGYRMFLDTRDTQSVKVYADAFEYINFGSSHLGIEGGFISVYRPDGTLAVTLQGMPNSTTGIIYNNTQEAGGPVGAPGGYDPGVVQVLPGQEGIWTVYFGYPNYVPVDFPNILNSAPWTRADDQPNNPRVVLAWDVTVSKDNAANLGGEMQSGRVYTNEYVTVVNQNGYNTSPTFYVMTKDGFIFEVDFMDADPFRFPISSNSGGFLMDDLQPVYNSQERQMIVRSDEPTSWTPGNYYLYEPQAEDYNGGQIVNNKIFFNPPDPDMPGVALTTDVFRNNTHMTWLYAEPTNFNVAINNFKLTAVGNTGDPCEAGFMQTGFGGQMLFESNVGGTAALQLDLNNNGSYTDVVDVTLFQQVTVGQNSIFWDGKDGLGNTVPPVTDFSLNYNLTVRGGETHILLTDVENNSGGVTFSLYNNIPTPNPDIFYYDHTPINGPVSGGGTPGNPLPTTTPFTYSSNFGNNKILDYWTFFEYNGAGTGTLTITISDDCNPTAPPPTGPDKDGDGIFDVVDIDDDNDGIPDRKEFCNPLGGFSCLPGGVDPSHDEDGDGILNYMDADDPAFSHTCPDNDNDGECDVLMPAYDIDRDGVPDHYDLDSDNDGIPDLVEAGHGQPDANGDGVIDGAPAAFGQNGLYNPIASNPDAQNAVETYSRFNKDGDTVPDHDDLDSDNDGINDVAEAGYGASDTNDNGRIDNGSGLPPTVDLDGLAPLINPDFTGVPIPLPPDWDGDGLRDWHDLDSDNDLIHDVEEAGLADADNDAIIGTGAPTVNLNGQATAINPTSHPNDTDGDNVADWHDLDSDNDGINDVREANGIDPDNDGLPGTNLPTVDLNGLPTNDNLGNSLVPSSQPQDTDNDNVRDYRDLDSDNDGINDVAETNLADADNNGRVGVGIPSVNTKGQATSIAPTSEPTDTDGDGTPDFRELDSDDDGVSDVTEANQPDPDFDGIIGNGVPNVNVNGQANSPTSAPTDTDGDNIPDFQELDADDDGILDEYECPSDSPCIDGDNDGTWDFQDIDRDDDGIIDSYECETGFPCPDTDGDGTPDVDDLDTDGDGIADIDECSNGAPCPDSNGNGIPEWREFFCNPNVALPQVMNIDGAGSFCEGASVLLSANNNIDVVGTEISYEWVGPNGFSFAGTANEFGPFNVSIPTLDMTNSGEYTLFLFTEEGCVGTPESVMLDVNSVPAAPALTVDNDEFCIGETLELNTGAVNGPNVSYQWFFDNGSGPSLLGQSSIPTFFVNDLDTDDSGIYTVQISNGNCGSQISNAQDINVGTTFSQTPSLDVDVDLLCAGETLELNASTISASNVEYEWWFDNGSGPVSLGTTNVPTFFINDVSASNTGVYNVSINVGNCNSNLSNSQDVTVDMLLGSFVPQLNIDEDFLCSGQDIELNSTPYAGSDVTYQWWFNGGAGATLIATSDVPTLFIENAQASYSGNYAVSILNGGCASQLSNLQDVDVNNDLSGIIPILDINEDVLCEGQTLELNSTPFAGQDMQYEWFFDSGTGPVSLGLSDIPTWFIEDVSDIDEGIYTVTVTMGLCITQPSNAHDVQVTNDFSNATPALSVVQDNPCEGETIELNSTIFSGGSVTYEWYFDNGATSTLIGMTNVPTFFINNADASHSGQYNVVVNVGNCTTQASNTQDIQVTDAVDDVTPQLDINESVLCDGETLELNSSTVTGGNVTYEWFFNDGTGQVSLGTTAVPTFFIGNVSDEHDGIYTVVAMVGNCATQQSNAQDLEVTENLTNVVPELTVNDNVLCSGETLELNSSIITGGDVTYEWFFNSGSGMVSLGTTDVPTFFLNDLTFDNSGIYEVTVSLGNCTSQPSNVESIIVNNELDMAPELSINSDVLCEGEMLELNSSMLTGNNVMYQWYFDDGNGPVLFETTSLPTIFIENTTGDNSGIYTVKVSSGNCLSQLSNAQDLMVQMSPNLEIGNTTDSLNLACPGDFVDLNVEMVPGATYQWFGPQGFTSDVPNVFIENIAAAQAGNYYVQVETQSCSFTSEGSTVYVWDELLADNDRYEIQMGEVVTSTSFLENDGFGNTENWTLDILVSPLNGTLSEIDGEIIYQPRTGFSGVDVFTYQICNDDCPDECSEAEVQVRVLEEGERFDDCFVPNIITPNGDGSNDDLRVPCLETEHTNNSLKIFNRWGDVVYQAQPYQNDWDGTYQNAPLPPGTYFYLLQLDVESKDCMQGYFTITR